jgi:hypothetical protein
MFVRSGHEQEEFTESIKKAVQWLSNPELNPLIESASRNSFNPIRYVRCGMYAELLAAWQRSYSHKNILVLFSEDFFSNPSGTANEVYSFLGLEPHDAGSWPHARDGGSCEKPPESVSRLMRDFFQPHNETLQLMLGKDLPWL